MSTGCGSWAKHYNQYLELGSFSQGHKRDLIPQNRIFIYWKNIHSFLSQNNGDWKLHFPASPTAKCGYITNFRLKEVLYDSVWGHTWRESCALFLLLLHFFLFPVGWNVKMMVSPTIWTWSVLGNGGQVWQSNKLEEDWASEDFKERVLSQPGPLTPGVLCDREIKFCL